MHITGNWHVHRLRMAGRTGSAIVIVSLSSTAAGGDMCRQSIRSDRRPHRAHHFILAALRSSGIGAPLVLDGPMTDPTFHTYAGQFLMPMLAPGEVVVPPCTPARVPHKDRMKCLLALHGRSRHA